MLEIYTPMAGSLCEEALNSLALLVGGSTFHSALKIASTIGVVGMAYQYVMASKIKSVMSFFVMSFTVTMILIGIKCPVVPYLRKWTQPIRSQPVFQSWQATEWVALYWAMRQAIGRAAAVATG